MSVHRRVTPCTLRQQIECLSAVSFYFGGLARREGVLADMQEKLQPDITLTAIGVYSLRTGQQHKLPPRRYRSLSTESSRPRTIRAQPFKWNVPVEEDATSCEVSVASKPPERPVLPLCNRTTVPRSRTARFGRMPKPPQQSCTQPVLNLSPGHSAFAVRHQLCSANTCPRIGTTAFEIFSLPHTMPPGTDHSRPDRMPRRRIRMSRFGAECDLSLWMRTTSCALRLGATPPCDVMSTITVLGATQTVELQDVQCSRRDASVSR